MLRPVRGLWQLVTAVEVEDLEVADFTVADPVVADTSPAESATAVAASALAGCAFPLVFPALRGQDHAFPHLGIRPTCSLSRAVLR